LLAVAFPLTLQVEEMKEVFACFDKDSSGAVTTAELALVLKSMNKHYTEAELQRVIGKFDVNGDGEIDFDGQWRNRADGRPAKPLFRWMRAGRRSLVPFDLDCC
jgi:hypothetical protein